MFVGRALSYDTQNGHIQFTPNLVRGQINITGRPPGSHSDRLGIAAWKRKDVNGREGAIGPFDPILQLIQCSDPNRGLSWPLYRREVYDDGRQVERAEILPATSSQKSE